MAAMPAAIGTSMASYRSYPRIVGVCWFNVNDTTAKTDFCIGSSSTSLAAFKAAVATGY